MAVPLLATSSSAVLLSTEGDAKAVCGERASTTLRNRGAHGLRSDLGPYYHAINLVYSQDRPAVVRQEDGSGFVFYPSSRRALALSAWNKSRRYSCCVFADKQNSPLLGSFNEWGEGEVLGQAKASDDSGQLASTEKPSSFTVKKGFVTVVTSGKTITHPVKSKEMSGKHPAPVELALNEALTVRYDFDVGILSFELNAKGIRERFYVGEVLAKCGDSSLTRSTSDGIIGRVKLESSNDISSIAGNLNTLKGSLNSYHVPPYTTCSLEKLDVKADLGKAVKALTAGRYVYTFDHKMKKFARNKHPLYPRFTKQTLEGQPMGIKHWSGRVEFETTLKDSKGIPDGLCRWVPPASAPRFSHTQLEEQLATGSPNLLVAILFSPWDAQSVHGVRLAEGLQGRLNAEKSDVFLTLVDMGESGALISERKWTNTLAQKYSVKATPWLLIFRNGTLLESTKLVGFKDRLRYVTLARSRALLVEPPGTVEGERAFPLGPKHALTSQNALKRAKISADTALGGKEALSMLGKSDSAYGFLFVSSEVPFAEIEAIVTLGTKRNPSCLFFLLHHPTMHQFDKEVERLANDSSRCTYVFTRPLSTGRIEQVFSKLDCTANKFPDAGMNAQELHEYIKQIAERNR